MRISRLLVTIALITTSLSAVPAGSLGATAAEPFGATAAGSLATAPAAATFPRIDASGFQLVQGSTFATYGARIAALETKPQLAPVGVPEVLAASNRTGRALCHATYLNAALNPQGFCWQDGEDDDLNVWIPQGVTGSGDAQPGGGARRVIAATWHNADDTAIRVSFLDVATNKYRHVLLVEPTSDSNFAAITGHGHGLYWSGNYLVVATSGSVLRVFDLRHVWRTDTSSEVVGLGADGKYHARWHAFALPQVGAYWYAGGGGCAASTGNRPCFSSLALDHTGSFVSAEHTARGGGRIVRWPHDPATGLPKTNAAGVVQASEALASPVWGMQGAVSSGDSFVITGVCPEYADNIGDGVDYPSCLHRGTAGGSTAVWTKAPKNTENLSHWPATHELWLISEQLRERVTVHIPWQ
ncbi:hypothetical protein [Kribbella italica]|uniref:Secreted protein n=1 Tax=Kribbella italica TaxID=1540520 RepID=A0A7W9J2U9_9ACTN|nr:hypothetical protein [Kribbella italica]MBB5833863.1 hypothetical protein [Kribbella italica]